MSAAPEKPFRSPHRTAMRSIQELTRYGSPSLVSLPYVPARFCALCCLMVFALCMLLGCSGAKQRKEAELTATLRLMRAELGQFTLQHKRRPHHLEELISEGYFKRIPNDPITGRNDSWRLVWGPDASGGSTPGITDVHSSSDQLARNGTPYSSW